MTRDRKDQVDRVAALPPHIAGCAGPTHFSRNALCDQLCLREVVGSLVTYCLVFALLPSLPHISFNLLLFPSESRPPSEAAMPQLCLRACSLRSPSKTPALPELHSLPPILPSGWLWTGQRPSYASFLQTLQDCCQASFFLAKHSQLLNKSSKCSF